MGTTQTFTRAGAFEQICMHRNANLNLLCTRQNHHAGDHAAVDLDGTVRASWATEKDLATQLAQTYVDALNRSGLVPHDWDHLPNVPRYEVHHGMQFVEAHLQSTGRLLGDDEMRLTAELAENLRMVLDNFGRHSITSDMTTAAERLADALFPATEPTEVTGQDFLDAMPTEPDCWDVCEGHPAPAEPAEEETKAEAFDLNVLVDQVTQAAWNERKRTKEFYGYDSQDWDELPSSKQQIEYSTIRGALTELQRLGLLTLPTSSPVVPAPTEASVIGGAAVALRSAMALLDPHEGGDWEHAWRTIGDLADCASRAYVAAPTETGPRYCSSCKLNVPPAPYCTNCGGDTIPRSPTETGPWQTWEAVPDDVWFTSASAVGFLPAHRKRGSLVDWQFRDGSVGVYDVSRIGNGKLMALAPFVAAEEG